jgi:MHS family proline/betaine transporter-like MFS transporter
MNFLKRFQPKTLVMIGNIFEYLDLYLYVHLAVILHQKFFPQISIDDNSVKVFTFMGLYIISPLARLFWGVFGDLRGRRGVLVKSSIFTSLITFLVVFIPTYDSMPLEYKMIPFYILFTLRILQAVGIAGEPLAAKLYALENVKDNVRDLPLSATKMCMTQMAGGILALGSAQIAMSLPWDFAWRFPFLLAFLGSILIMYIRLYLTETKEYQELPVSSKQVKLFDFLISEIWQAQNFKNITFISFTVLSVSYPILFVFSYTFLSPLVVKQLGHPKDFIIVYNLILCVLELIFAYVSVWIPVKLGLSKKWVMGIYHLISITTVIIFATGIISKNLPMGVYLLLQVILITGVNWDLIFGSVAKTFPITQRFCLMAIGGSGASILQYILVAFILPFFLDMKDIEIYAMVCTAFIILAMIMVYLYIPYENLAIENDKRIQKEYKKNTKRIQKEYKKNTKRIQKEYKN